MLLPMVPVSLLVAVRSPLSCPAWQHGKKGLLNEVLLSLKCEFDAFDAIHNLTDNRPKQDYPGYRPCRIHQGLPLLWN